MRNKIIFLVGCILLMGIVFAIEVGNRQDAIDRLDAIKQNRTIMMDELVFHSITYTKDKECIIDYDTEEISCEICFVFDYTVDDRRLDDEACINVPEDSTARDESNIMTAYARYLIEKNYPREEVTYTIDRV